MTASKIRDDVELITETGIVAIVRAAAASIDQLLAAADAVKAGGVNAIEVTLTTPGALNVISEAAHRYGSDVLFGAGSVLDAESARAAILAGAQFIVCPTLNLKLIELCKRYSVPVMPGAFTATEILTAWEAGADWVKLFPATIGGAGYVKAIKAPLPHVKLAAVGGINLNNTAEFIRAGAEIVGIGNDLLNQQLLENGDYEAITDRARQFRQQVEIGRSQK